MTRPAGLAVPAVDSAANVTSSDVGGNKNDTVAGDSVVSLIKTAVADVATVDGLHNVPAANSGANTRMSEVVGNKSDGAGATSLVGLIKTADAAIDTVDGLHDVPDPNSTDNTHMRDVVGNRTDRAHDGGDSIYGRLADVERWMHGAHNVYPTLADGVTLTTDAAGWTLGTAVEVVPASTITTDFVIRSVGVEDVSADDVYEIVCYDGNDQELCRGRFTRTAAQDVPGHVNLTSEVVAANTQIKAAIACATAAERTVVVSIDYIPYAS